MGVDYGSSVAVGFYFTAEELEKRFTQTVAEVYHQEWRYDEKTGDRYSIKVLDNEPGERVIFGSTDLTGRIDELVEVICREMGEALGFRVCFWQGGNWYEGRYDFVIGPDIETEDGVLDPIRFTPEQFSRADAVRAKLLELGLPSEGYRIFSLESIT